MMELGMVWVPQMVSKVCWATLAGSLAVGLASNTGPEGDKLRKLKASNKLAVNENLVVATSDFWLFALFSSASAVGLWCAFAEKVALYDASFDATGKFSISKLRTISQSNSEVFMVNLWVGTLCKAIATATVLFDLVLGRRVTPSVSQIFLDLFDPILFAALLYVFELGYSPLETSLARGFDTSLPQNEVLFLYTAESVLLELFVCLMISTALALMPWVRYYKFASKLIDQQMQIGERITVQVHAKMLESSDFKPTEPTKPNNPPQGVDEIDAKHSQPSLQETQGREEATSEKQEDVEPAEPLTEDLVLAEQEKVDEICEGESEEVEVLAILESTVEQSIVEEPTLKEEGNEQEESKVASDEVKESVKKETESVKTETKKTGTGKREETSDGLHGPEQQLDFVLGVATVAVGSVLYLVQGFKR